jgi:hypothetical protein
MMIKIFVVTLPSLNRTIQSAAFLKREDAEKFKDYVDSTNGATVDSATISTMSLFRNTDMMVIPKK